MAGDTVQDRNKTIIRRLFEEVFQLADIDALDDVVAPEFVDHDPVPGQPAGIEGVRYVVRYLHRAFATPRFVVEDLIAEGNRVVARWWVSGASTGAIPDLPPAGTPATSGIIVIFRMENGKVVERWAAYQR